LSKYFNGRITTNKSPSNPIPRLKYPIIDTAVSSICRENYVFSSFVTAQGTLAEPVNPVDENPPSRPG